MLKAIYWLKDSNHLRLIMITGILLFPVVILLIPPDWFSEQNSVCLFKNFTGRECYGCGMSRAVVYAAHFQFDNALHYNKMVMIVLPLLIYIWAKSLITLWNRKISF